VTHTKTGRAEVDGQRQQGHSMSPNGDAPIPSVTPVADSTAVSPIRKCGPYSSDRTHDHRLLPNLCTFCKDCNTSWL
jgi:hypothetical protein